jgi:hypothetical protein
MIFLSSAAHLTAGIVLGFLYFRSLWWNTCRFTGGGRVTLASLEGALPLLMMALGVLIARSVVVRRVREAAP